MKKNLFISILLLSSAITSLGMDTNSPFPLFNLPNEIVATIVATSHGETKNMLAQTCKALHALASFKYRDRLLEHPSIYLGPIEKHLLLLEYVETNNANMVNHMFALGATYDVLTFFGEWHDPLPGLGSISTVYEPYNNSFPVNRIPHTCIDTVRTLLHIAIVKKHCDIAKIILDQVHSYASGTQAYVRKKTVDYINTSDKNGETPLLLAVKNNDLKTTALLLSYKELDRSAIDNIILQQSFSDEMVKLLTPTRQ